MEIPHGGMIMRQPKQCSKTSTILEKKISCKPRFKVIDDGKIIGILTQTDQFVPTHPHTLEATHGDRLIPYILNADILAANKRIWENTARRSRENKYGTANSTRNKFL